MLCPKGRVGSSPTMGTLSGGSAGSKETSQDFGAYLMTRNQKRRSLIRHRLINKLLTLHVPSCWYCRIVSPDAKCAGFRVIFDERGHSRTTFRDWSIEDLAKMVTNAMR